jgi:LCP family protein required for cell wall assembly
MMRLSRLRAALVGRPGVTSLTPCSGGGEGVGVCGEWGMTGKGTVGCGDAHMSNWPEGWDRGDAPKDPPARPAAPKDVDEPTQAMARPVESTQAMQRPVESTQAMQLPDEPTQVLRRPVEPRRPDPGYPPPAAPGRRTPDDSEPPRRGRGRRWLRRTLLVLLLIAALFVGLVFFFYSRIGKIDALQDYAGRPAATPGQDWLLVGSDSRKGLTNKQTRKLHVGHAGGQRTDTIILLHKPSSGPSTLVSLPRDSYVPIPGHGRNKLNAAYAFGGAPLLVRTVETATGIRIDHYAEIGFGGFVGMTDAVGGVKLCPSRNINDKKAGLHVKKGCQTMNGPTALGYVRARYFDPKGDLGRVQRQQEFLSAVFAKASSPTTLLNPFRLIPLGNAGTTALTVDKRDGPLDLVRFALAMRAVAGGKGIQTTVPVADPDYRTSVGSTVRWDRTKAIELFRSLR